MTETKQKYKRVKSYTTHFPGLGECEVRGESLKDGNLIVCSANVMRNDNMFVVDPSYRCDHCKSVSFRKYRPALDGA